MMGFASLYPSYGRLKIEQDGESEAKPITQEAACSLLLLALLLSSRCF